MPTALDPVFARALRLLHRGGTYGYWWGLPDKVTRWWPVGSPMPVPNGSTQHVYFGVNPTGARKDRGRAAVTDIAAINCLFAEFDAKDYGGDKAKARARLDAVDLPASLIIDSGGGYHAYWFFVEPFIIGGGEDRQRAIEAQRLWVDYVGSDKASKDLARVLRVPGTLNRKPKYGPNFPTVKIDYAGFEQYDFATLCEVAGHGLAQRSATVKPAQPPKPQTNAQPINLDDHALIERAKSARNGAQFAALWHGDRSAYSGDDSAADQALCNHLAFWTGNDAARVDRMFRQSGLMRPKWDEIHYSDGRTYGAGTIDEAIAGTHNTYSPPRATAITPPMPTADHATSSAQGERFDLSDVGNGRRFAVRFAGRVRYVSAWGWMVWDGKRWQIDDAGAIYRMAREVVRSILDEAAGATDERAKALAKWFASSQNLTRIKAMIEIAKSEPELVARPDDFDQDQMLLNVGNGVIDLRTGDLLPHDTARLITKITPIDYDPDATCPLWVRFLDRIMGGNRALIEFLQRAIGYSLTGRTGEQVLFLLWGTGANGKSVLSSIFMTLLGSYAKTAEFSTFLTKTNDTIRNDVARLAGARLVSAIEAGDGRRLSEALVKSLTGGDVITARFLNHEYFEFRPAFKLWLATNHKPIIRGDDYAIWRRIRLIPFEITIPEPERDPQLADKLQAELPGILAWAVRGCLDWQRQGMGTPDEVKAATETYRDEMDVLSDFIAAECVMLDSAVTRAGALYAAYRAWCDESGERAQSTRSFKQRMIERGLIFDRDKRGNFWHGIGLVSPDGA